MGCQRMEDVIRETTMQSPRGRDARRVRASGGRTVERDGQGWQDPGHSRQEEKDFTASGTGAF